MRKIYALTFAIVLSAATLMSGQATRTWVSGVGDDANPCSRTAPCKTWAGAISKTAPNGEIDALDPGGFGALTITKPITLDGGGGQVGSTLVSGTNGINISLNAAGTAHIVNSLIKNVGNCVGGACTTGTGNGIFATSSNGNTAMVTVYNTQIIGSANNGVEAGSNSRIIVDRSLISASVNNGVLADGTAGTCNIGVDNSDILYGGNGTTASNSGCFVNVSHTTIAYNSGTAYNPITGGSVIAYGTGTTGNVIGSNLIHDNTVGTPTKMNPLQ